MNSEEKQLSISFVLPTFNERNNIVFLIEEILKLTSQHEIEIIVVDDNSNDGTSEIVRNLAQLEKKIKLINRFNRFGLSSAIKEGCINATFDIIAIMDSDGQHEVKDVLNAIRKLIHKKFDVVFGSRFLKKSKIQGLSKKRQTGSILANKFARISLSRKYKNLTDFMSGCIVLKRESCFLYLTKIDVNGFKFLFELLSLSKGNLNVSEVPLSFKSRTGGSSKFDIAIFWDFLISLIHTFLKRIVPRRAISFAFVGAVGVIVQLLSSYLLMIFIGFTFQLALPIAVTCAACSNFFINNWLTFRNKRLKNKELIFALFKFLLISSLPIIANVGLATSIYNLILPSTLLSQLAGIVIVFIWNYAASSRFVWET